MIIENSITDEDLKKLIRFKKKYLSLYPIDLQKEIEDKLFLGFTDNNDIINQIYSFVNIIKKDLNPYLYFSNFVNEKFKTKEKRILEVGAGIIPVLTNLMENQFNIKIDCIDKKIIFKYLVKGKIFEEDFSLKTNISNYDLLIGYNPCGATENIIRNAINNQKEFCIALCGCSFIPGEKNPPKWHEELLKSAKELSNSNLYNIEMVEIPQKYNIKWPIIYGQLK